MNLCESCENYIGSYCFKGHQLNPKTCIDYVLDCSECKNYNCFDDGDGRLDIWCHLKSDDDFLTPQREECPDFKLN